MSKKMLIDAAHPEETRVTVLSGNRLEDFDVEVASRKQLKGNIYLAKVTRVEPSLQAAFVDYGGNRHGFLAFNEIHPDYYQIPVEDREALLAEHQAEINADSDEEASDGDEEEGVKVEEVGGDDIEDAERRPKRVPPKSYKIQEVIKRRQILLIQVVKEERGNKGAALTTYISLAGRYCVLMPNTARGGGISRKIANSADRKKLKTMLKDFGIPGGMAVIVRTAGAKHSKAEIKRDYEYLIRLWDQIRQTTLESSAPCLVHEEAHLIKRAIRDLYTKDIDEIIVEGDDGYRTAKDFMKLLIPSHAKKVQPYKDSTLPLFHRYQAENQLDQIHSPEVQLKSGGYIVINPTEALVSIDVNSGRSTRERNIEETALKTNMEAAEEIARQLKLRDLAGLIVIDFIDMEVNRNNSQVERRMKEAMKNDRARIQVGRISPFGLLELSRQRLRPSLIETTSSPCQHCGGTGVQRSTESTALHVLRAIEEEGSKRRADEISVFVPTGVALYILNHKRHALAEIEQRYHLEILVEADDVLIAPQFRIERTKSYSGPAPTDEELKAAEVIELEEDEDNSQDEGEGNGKRRRRRRRRRRKGDDNETQNAAAEDDIQERSDDTEDADDGDRETHRAEEGEEVDGEQKSKRRRRGRRGGRRRRRNRDQSDEIQAEDVQAQEGDAEPTLLSGPDEPELLSPPESAPAIEMPAPDGDVQTEAEPEAKEEKPKRRRSRRKKQPTEAAPETETVVEAAPDVAVDAEPDPEPQPESVPETQSEPAEKSDPAPESAKTEVINVDAVETESPRRGWWNRLTQ